MVLISLVLVLNLLYFYISTLLLLLFSVIRTKLFQQHVVQLMGETKVEFC